MAVNLVVLVDEEAVGFALLVEVDVETFDLRSWVVHGDQSLVELVGQIRGYPCRCADENLVVDSD